MSAAPVKEVATTPGVVDNAVGRINRSVSGETVSCSLFRAAAKGSEEPLTRQALSFIGRDEARHARIGGDARLAIHRLGT